MTFKLRAERTKYLCFDIDPYSIEIVLGDYFLLKEPLWAEFWKPLNATFYEDSDDNSAVLVPDITVWATQNCLALNQKAYELLQHPLSAYGEFLPAVCEGVPYWIFHSTTRLGLEYVDLEASERVIEDTGFIDMKSLAFEEHAISDVLIFQTEFNDYRNMYCSENFKQLVEKEKLKGLRFSDDLACTTEP